MPLVQIKIGAAIFSRDVPVADFEAEKALFDSLGDYKKRLYESYALIGAYDSVFAQGDSALLEELDQRGFSSEQQVRDEYAAYKKLERHYHPPKSWVRRAFFGRFF